MPPQDPPLFRLDKGTLVPIGLLVAVVLSAISATVWINTYLLQLSHKVERVDDRLGALAANVAAINAGTWSLADMRSWTDLLRVSNQSLHVPEARQVTK